METSTSFIARSLYRRLWRACGPAVNKATAPTRALRKSVRDSFRETREVSDPVTREMLLERGENTARFLYSAAHTGSREHQLTHNIAAMTMFRRGYAGRPPVKHKLNKEQQALHDDVYAAFERTLAAVNESHNLSLR
ncbi:hypothetical protein THASP1DRAFT_29291 [Thamnocephalis sphaerospora]|uniref:Complex 1 LYR protein domain-containing protein n=1 Tax=Thamnocephalis sphaerospora TaxID=78915 RepID=A0A4P9XS43_9FUNG|nr:hypothetical protein THASP1DRAFT_29291 [Thamnocephalis sphaerospora]|eukprot:RKP08925.1 hypothetical protein THASP1DRAFT_29291 [Thamnocephalis sphaerospora]